ncbi:MAG TPA: CYTH domain-containing protein [Candidatus Absconditabacterales bacterium]|nr:CYTH domain-containing protein [Candidatus Absconditabacterales bacterium]
MNIEYEVKFLAIEQAEMQKKLKAIGAELRHEKTMMRRLVYENLLNKSSYLRLRDEGHKVTLTYKEVVATDHIEGVKEIEVQISDFESMKLMISKLGMNMKSYQETYRETRFKDGIQITIDERPGLRPFIEIEAESEEKVKEFSQLLGFDYEKGVFGTVSDIYLLELGIKPDVINYMPKITFEEPPQLYIS